ncbi:MULTISPECIES: hypothetical protein [unclassified Sphingomonas]|uniref:hypothetical protein n=1 Tax=unclassified Sphingomonas TaxID=196159 RepID=UPI00226A93A5|nr:MULTISPECIES: hypothetical protein [unclassified Sphingomonas]
MSKTLGAILSTAGSIAVAIPGLQIVGVGLIAAGAVTAALDKPNLPSQKTDSAVKQPVPPRWSGYGTARQYCAVELVG